LDKYDTPLFAFSQSGVETLSSDLFVGDDMLRWEEIKEIFILWARLGGLQIPTIRLVNLDEVLHRLPEAKAEHIRTIEQSTPEYKNMYEANRRTSQA